MVVDSLEATDVEGNNHAAEASSTESFAFFMIAPKTPHAEEGLLKYSERYGKYPLLALLHNVHEVALQVLEWLWLHCNVMLKVLSHKTEQFFIHSRRFHAECSSWITRTDHDF